MEVTKLNHATALSTYADIWMLPPFNETKWSKIVDYYLNFMILKSQNKKSAQLNDNLKSILLKEDIPNTVMTEKSKTPLMVAAQNYLPAKQIIYFNHLESLNEYTVAINKIALQLRSSSIKVFIPETMSTDDIRKKINTESHTTVYLIDQVSSL